MAPQNNGRAVAWLALAAIIFLSLVPPGVRPTTFLPHKIEHAGIFFFDGLAFGIAYLGYEWLMAVERLGGDILRRHRACPTDDSRSTRAVQRFCRRRDRCLRRYFCRLNADPDERTPLPVKSDHALLLCKVAPASRGNWGRETGTVALTIESQPNLAALSVLQYEVDHIVTSSDQQNDERDQCKAADEHRPVPGIETEKSTLGRDTQAHIL